MRARGRTYNNADVRRLEARARHEERQAVLRYLSAATACYPEDIWPDNPTTPDGFAAKGMRFILERMRKEIADGRHAR